MSGNFCIFAIGKKNKNTVTGMKEIRCPKCGSAISVDEGDYAAILGQVRNEEFARELQSHLGEMRQRMAAEAEAKRVQIEQQYKLQLQQEAGRLQLKEREVQELKEREAKIRLEEEQRAQTALSGLREEVARLKAEAAGVDDRIKRVQLEEQGRMREAVHEKEGEIARLNSQLQLDQSKAREAERSMKEQYELRLQQANEMVAYYKDMKSRLSTKMVGETLELHCSTLYNTTLRPVLENAYFEKDNDVVGGSKGDFVFRDFIDGEEYVSIMFEMKNDMETSVVRHRNTEFLDKLNRDRENKHCDYAVLVSLLEPDNELYNSGIVDMSARYPRMYVIRPQFFIPLITLLVQTSRKAAEYRRKLALAEQQTIDVAKFEEKLDRFKTDFGKNFEKAKVKYAKAIDEIDQSIKHLQAVRDALVGSRDALEKANDKTEELTIRRLTYGNKTMREKLAAGKEGEE